MNSNIQVPSIVGDWMLKYTDSAGIHIEFSQDGLLNDGWGSHLTLLENDSAYWTNSGFGTQPSIYLPGKYSTSFDTAYQSTITFSFVPYTWLPFSDSTFNYMLRNNDTLKLKSLDASPIVYTYWKK